MDQCLLYSRGDKSKVGEMTGDEMRGRWSNPYCTVIETRAGFER